MTYMSPFSKDPCLTYGNMLQKLKYWKNFKFISLTVVVFMVTFLFTQHFLFTLDSDAIYKERGILLPIKKPTIFSVSSDKPIIWKQNRWNFHVERDHDFQNSISRDYTKTNLLSLKQNKTNFRIAWYQHDPEIQRSLSNYDPQNCNIRNCVIVQNSSLADIVVLRHSFLPFNPVIQKRKGQLWVLYSSESPHHTRSPPRDWANQIDLSASYMESSDFFVALYGRTETRKGRLQRNYTGILTNKTKDAVWVSSHCFTPARREELVKELSKYLTVDTFGTCGTKSCGKQYDDLKQCEAIFVNNYKFYLSFENSICDNYTTEKLYFLFRDASAIIPVVNGPRDVYKYVPKNTFVNSFDYASPKLLAEKLKEIGNNETEYIRFLKEKEKYTMPRQSVNDLIDMAIHKFQCDMCRYLYELDIGKRSKKPKTWQHVFDPNIQCKN